jgi:hypothetical protein
MTTPLALPTMSGSIVTFLTVIAVIFAGILLYALHKKGDVRAVLSHGKTMFELEAKERKSQRRSSGRTRV